MMGGDGHAVDLINLLTAKTAKDIGLDMATKSTGNGPKARSNLYWRGGKIL